LRALRLQASGLLWVWQGFDSGLLEKNMQFLYLAPPGLQFLSLTLQVPLKRAYQVAQKTNLLGRGGLGRDRRSNILGDRGLMSFSHGTWGRRSNGSLRLDRSLR
jgi:hypothetical protein